MTKEQAIALVRDWASVVKSELCVSASERAEVEEECEEVVEILKVQENKEVK